MNKTSFFDGVRGTLSTVKLSREEMKLIKGGGLDPEQSTCWYGLPFGGTAQYLCPADSMTCETLCEDDYGDACMGCAEVLG